MSDDPKRVIVITDGDSTARRVVEQVAANIGGRCISMSAGNPTEVSAREIAAAIKRSSGRIVLVMVDDGGLRGTGPGESALAALCRDPEIKIIGAIAVASHTSKVRGVPVAVSVDRQGRTVAGAVDKDGLAKGAERVVGDTVDILNRLKIPIIVGVGDLGKMDKADDVDHGARVTTEAVQEILRRAGEPAAGRG